MGIDFRECLYALSDAIINRPPPIRLYDQIYMKLPDILLQAELLSRWFADKSVVFVGDGDAIAVSLAHLFKQKQFESGPRSLRVLDFDERIIHSVNRFADEKHLDSLLSAELYNVADPLPKQHWQAYDAFYTNPPWGKSNQGMSVRTFIMRGIEAVKGDALGCIVIGDHSKRLWTHEVQVTTQRFVLDQGFRVAEMLPEFHRYHLDDDPDLKSCSLVIQRAGCSTKPYDSKPLSQEGMANFYGENNPLTVRYIRDLTEGGSRISHDIQYVKFSEDQR